MRKLIRDHRGFLAFLLLFGFFRTAIADWNPVPSGSMRPTLLEGDVVLVNRLAFDLKVPLTDIIVLHTGEPGRGDVATFSSPRDGTRLIKRIVAVPGDVVEMRDRILIVNGEPALYQPVATVTEHPYPGVEVGAQRLRERTSGRDRVVQWFDIPERPGRDDFGPATIPADRFLMLGDNRDDSADSRYFGLVPRERLIGRAIAIAVSADITGNWAPRFDRFGASLD